VLAHFSAPCRGIVVAAMECRRLCAFATVALVVKRSGLLSTARCAFVQPRGDVSSAGTFACDGIVNIRLLEVNAAAPAHGPNTGSAAPLAATAALFAAGLAVADSCRGARRGVARCAAKKDKGGKSDKGGKAGGGGKGGGGGGGGEEDGDDVDSDELIKGWDENMEKSMERLRIDLGGIRAGKASPQLLEGIKISAYDTTMGMNDIGSITVLDNFTLQVNCFDVDIVKIVEKAIRAQDDSFMISGVGHAIQVKVPPLTQDKRSSYVKLVKDLGEKTKVALRGTRQKAIKKADGFKTSMGDDFVKSMKSQVEDLVKKHTGEVDKMLKLKETALMEL